MEFLTDTQPGVHLSAVQHNLLTKTKVAIYGSSLDEPALTGGFTDKSLSGGESRYLSVPGLATSIAIDGYDPNLDEQILDSALVSLPRYQHNHDIMVMFGELAVDVSDQWPGPQLAETHGIQLLDDAGNSSLIAEAKQPAAVDTYPAMAGTFSENGKQRTVLHVPFTNELLSVENPDGALTNEVLGSLGVVLAYAD